VARAAGLRAALRVAFFAVFRPAFFAVPPLLLLVAFAVFFTVLRAAGLGAATLTIVGGVGAGGAALALGLRLAAAAARRAAMRSASAAASPRARWTMPEIAEVMPLVTASMLPAALPSAPPSVSAAVSSVPSAFSFSSSSVGNFDMVSPCTANRRGALFCVRSRLNHAGARTASTGADRNTAEAVVSVAKDIGPQPGDDVYFGRSGGNNRGQKDERTGEDQPPRHTRGMITHIRAISPKLSSEIIRRARERDACWIVGRASMPRPWLS
jgi:hypothetical protein